MSDAKKSYLRFSLAQRVEHIVLLLSFSILGLTGLPQKYPLSPISQAIVEGLGGIENVRVIHRIAATVFIIEAIYHLVVLGYKLYVRRLEASMVPTIKDGTDALESIQYNLGLRDKSPKMPRYNFTEKAEYWAMLWGLLVMAVTGFMLWNPIATTNFLSGEFIPAAKVAHGAEAVLAVLAIILWHFWHVHLRLFNKSIFTGRIDRHAMEDEHGLELTQIESGRLPAPPDADEQRARMTIFIPVASIVSVVLLVGVYFFITFEQSSITTLPPAQQVAILVTQTPTIAPPTATPAPTQPPPADQEEGQVKVQEASLAWVGGIDALFKEKCSSCHGSVGGFSAEEYAGVMKAVKPGNPEDSLIIKVQQDSHPGQFTEEQLAQVVAWIEAGAPETAAGGRQTEQSSASETVTWGGQVEALFAAKCGACHGTSGGFSAKTYDDILKAVEPGNPNDSPVVTIQQAGGHPGNFTEEELQTVIDWIQAGAPQ
jgi:cytochrome b subunit of formate dehydrogenase/mono/diheme cytochrome c family protein